MALAVAALSLSACGGDDDSGGGGEAEQPAQLAITLEEQGKKATLEADQPTTEAGTVELQFTNNGKSPHSVQLARVDEGHEAEEVLQAGEAWASGKKPLPEWAHLAGGIGSVKGGESGTATVQLEPGKYVALDTNAEGVPPFAEFEATGEAGGGELPSTDATIEAKDYSFESSGLTAGQNTVTFDNTGQQPHVAEAIGIKGDATIEDVKKFIETEKGEPPIDESKSFGTAIVDGGQSLVQEMNLEAGRYVVICYVPDREGGPPHLARGMVSELEVK
jgi:plastocyanin